ESGVVGVKVFALPPSNSGPASSFNTKVPLPGLTVEEVQLQVGVSSAVKAPSTPTKDTASGTLLSNVTVIEAVFVLPALSVAVATREFPPSFKVSPPLLQLPAVSVAAPFPDMAPETETESRPDSKSLDVPLSENAAVPVIWVVGPLIATAGATLSTRMVTSSEPSAPPTFVLAARTLLEPAIRLTVLSTKMSVFRAVSLT